MRWVCPNCGLELDEFALENLDLEYIDEETPVCPNCGAEMLLLEEPEEELVIEVVEYEEELEYF
ncbi:MAG: hypothetical protein GXO42_00200 [bacterium]|nr:hypothetical protein [bacterium]